MGLNGKMIIAGERVAGTLGTLKSYNPATNSEIDEPTFYMGGASEVDLAAQSAFKAFDFYRAIPQETRARFLDSIAVEIENRSEALIARAHAESALPLARLNGELARTTGQLRLFAQVVRDGSYIDATLDSALPHRTPAPRPDLRLAKIPIGPVAVFGASNFPFAFSVAGGDTASALAAGCPVVVKGHNAHLGTSELMAEAVLAAIESHNIPKGVFSLVNGLGNEIGHSLVTHPAICAVGFTGSRVGGLALMRAAAIDRKVPIPVYAEMSSINPNFLFSQALESRHDSIAAAFVDSLVLGAGQFCTNPGLIIGVESPELDKFILSASKAMSSKPPQTMLTAGIYKAYTTGQETLSRNGHVEVSASGKSDAQILNGAVPGLYVVSGSEFLANEQLSTEIFGPTSIIVKATNVDQMLQIAESLEGQLTATVHIDAGDKAAVEKLFPTLERKAGRILTNGFSTGVEVSHSMVHGGPYPATSNSMYTSVGAKAIERFVRPVCYQNCPDYLLPQCLADGNPLHIRRTIDGKEILP